MSPWTEAVIGRLKERLEAARKLHARNEEIERLAHAEKHHSGFQVHFLEEAISSLEKLAEFEGKGGTQ